MDALTDALGQLEQTVVKEQIGKCVPPGAQKALAAAGLRDEFLFPVPAVLEAKPSLVGYYRLLLGVPQKSFYGSAQESEKLVDLLDSRVAVWRYARRDERQ
ncbi:MAG: XcyI family restriction endonuclease [Acidobacteriia bacterium]|nr:XcyI family restriction endonuclease [Terriglobia bacterium]